MADYRSVQTRMWREDEWFQGLEPEARLFWIYLFTNPSASPAGIYRLPIKTMAFESGIDYDKACDLMEQFASVGKAYYNGGVVWVVNMRRLQFPDLDGSGAWQTATRIQKDIDCIPDDNPLKQEYLMRSGYPTIEETGKKKTVSIVYGWGIDTQSVNKTITVTKRNETKQEEDGLPPAAAAAAIPDETIDAFKSQYENILGTMPTAVFPDAREYMAKLHARAADDWWLMALRETVDYANRPGWPYMKSVLERWLAAGAANPTAGKGKQTNGKSSLGLRRDPNDYPTHKPDAAEIAELQRALAEAEANAARPAHLS